ncbi:MAG: helicase-associated domain-containing protein [Planctomycetes bacterium]|nr:helicase-associated domain-containing protein [Planctomycetota bacterium]
MKHFDMAGRFNRPAPKLPPLLKPVETFQADLLVQDMTTVLSLCHAEPMRVRASDYAIFSKARSLIEDHLVSLPEWLTSLNYYPLSERPLLAMDILYDLGFASTCGKRGRDYRVEVSKKGIEWLSRTATERVKFIFDLLIENRGSLTARGGERTIWLPIPNRYWLDKKKKTDLKATLDRAFRQLGTDAFRDLEGFISYQSIEANPLKEGETANELRQALLPRNQRHCSEEHMEKAWKKFLFDFAIHRLAKLGGIELGYTQDRQVCLALTPWGQYHLGLTNEFKVPEQEAQDVFVQPNFEVVFFGPCASAEAEIGRFSERVGKGAGTLFKITKASILHAAEVGLTAEQVLSTLEKVSTKSIPPNISREISGWFASCRQIRVKSTILIHCPDEETAMRIMSLGKRDVTALTSHILELPSARAKKALVGKLRKQGIFVS